jgi:hypothetical protein
MVRTIVSVLSSTRRIYLAFALFVGMASVALLSSCAPPIPGVSISPVATRVVPSPDDNLVLVSADVISNTVIPEGAWVIGSVDDMEFKVTGTPSPFAFSPNRSQSRSAILQKSDLSSLAPSAVVLVPRDTLGADAKVKVFGDLHPGAGFTLTPGRIPVYSSDDILIPDKSVDGVWKVLIRPSAVGGISGSGIITQTNASPWEFTLEFSAIDCPHCDFGDVCQRILGCCAILPICQP